MNSATLGDALREAARRIDPVDARVLLCHVVQRGSAYVAAHPEIELRPADRDRYAELVARRVRGEPVAYLTGHREFYGKPFRVSPATLIPRPETELLVDLALERLPHDGAARVMDLGTGTGCIAISIASERSRLRILGIDSSREALALARRNALDRGVGNVAFLQSDWYSALRPGERFDLIVSNPPYVAAGDPHLEKGDLRFEPRVALDGGRDGIEALRAIIVGAGVHLAGNGWILVEHGFDQAERVRGLLIEQGYESVFSARDLAGIERASGGRLTPDSTAR
jgi:release factor glutamine methyltransferase